MNLLGKLMSPKLGLTVVKSHLEKHFDKDIEKFDMIYYGERNTIDFKVFGKLHNYLDGETLCNLIANLCKSRLQQGATLDSPVIQDQPAPSPTIDPTIDVKPIIPVIVKKKDNTVIILLIIIIIITIGIYMYKNLKDNE